MNRLLKITAQIVGLLILLYIAIMILLMIFVNTKDFKPVISKTFYEMTGQKLKIDGDIHLRIFPWPSIKATNLTLENPKAFPAPVTAPFLAKVGQLSVRLRAAALLKGNIDPANILLSNVHVNLITAKDGKTNWGDFLKPKQKISTDNTDVTPRKPSAPVMNNYKLPVVQINDANLHFINLQTNKEASVTNLQVVTPPSRDNSARHISISCKISRAQPKTQLDLKISSLFNFSEGNSTLNLNKLHMIIRFFQVGHKLQTPIALLMRGSVAVNGSNFETILNANFGEDEGNIQLAAKRKAGSIQAAVILKNVAVTPLTEILTGKKWLSGSINASTSLTTKGKTFNDWIAQLAGKGELNITKGKIHGLNMDSMIIGALGSLLSGQKTNLNQEQTTAFDQISTSYTINKGILTTNDFLIKSPTFNAKGSGNINLPKTSINAKLYATYANNTQWKIPLIIKGSVFNPVIRPDASSIANQFLNSQKGNSIGKALKKAEKQLKSIFK